MTKAQLAKKAIEFLDRNSRKVISSGANPFAQHVEMRDTVNGLDIYFHIQQSPYGNGYSEVKVRYHGKLVLSGAHGNGWLEGIRVTTYLPGAWEKRLK